MGGMLPLGYKRHPDPQRQELVVNEAEAEQVRALFSLYDEHHHLGRVAEAAERQGIRSKLRATRTGERSGGRVLTRGQIHHILTNVTYRGLTKHKAEAFPGLHPAIIDHDLWDRVQAKLQEQGVVPTHTAPGAAAERIAQELDKWRTVIAEAGVKPD